MKKQGFDFSHFKQLLLFSFGFTRLLDFKPIKEKNNREFLIQTLQFLS